MKYIGIDLAWTNKNETGLCIFEDKSCIFLDAKVYTNDELVTIIKDNEPCIVSIDGPLVVDNEKGGRSVDSILMKTPINDRYLKLYATSKTYMIRSFGGIRGVDIKTQLQSKVLGSDLLETFPTGIFLSLFLDIYDNKYKISSRLKLNDLKDNALSLLNRIKGLGFDFDLDLYDVNTKKAYKLEEDKIDAILCALNSYYHHHKQSLVFQDQSGCIVLPKKWSSFN